jgi:formylglycine-generating enzyme required for sulfatase activity
MFVGPLLEVAVSATIQWCISPSHPLRLPAMRSPFALFKFAARCLLNAGSFGLAGEFVVDVIPDLARDLWDSWGKGQQPAALREELQVMASSADSEVKRQAQDAVREASATSPPSPSAAASVVTYLTQVPAMIRATTRRPADPSGKTVPPSLPLSKAPDLVPILPTRLPRFAKGQRAPGFGDWTLDEPLGFGGFGEVWRATHEALPPRAIKFCLDATTAISLRNESKLLGQVAHQGTHPGIVTLHDTALSSDPPALSYEYVGGGDLVSLIRIWHASQSATLLDDSLTLLREIAGIVGFAHGLNPPIVHRDLKPSNILIQPDGKKVRPRVADFGIGGLVRHPDTPQSRQMTMLRGAYTPVYSSPQQKDGDDPSLQDDVYSLGVVALHLFSGDLRLEPTGDWAEFLRDEHEVPEAVLEVLKGCFARPKKRWKDGNVVAAKLAEAMGGVPVVPVVVTPPPVQKKVTAPAVDPSIQAAMSDLSGLVPTHERARALAKANQWCEAADVLANVPEQLRDRSLFTTLSENCARVKSLDARIRELIKAKNYRKLRQPIEELLALTPQREDLRGLLPGLPATLPAEFTNSIGMKFKLIPEGVFIMGSPTSEADRRDNETQHEVEISEPFYMGIYQVTQAEWQRIMGSNPSHFKGAGNLPVESVSWNDVQDFLKKLAALPEEMAKGRRYLLPSEAQWEYTCREGKSGANYKVFHYGNSLSSTEANFDGNNPYGGAAKGQYLGKTTPVGTYKANAFGIYDMHGNVWEWCQDWYDGGYYNVSPKKDPSGPTSGSSRVLRGGSWYGYGHYCRSACRGSNDPDYRGNRIGFRVVCVS